MVVVVVVAVVVVLVLVAVVTVVVIPRICQTSIRQNLATRFFRKLSEVNRWPSTICEDL